MSFTKFELADALRVSSADTSKLIGNLKNQYGLGNDSKRVEMLGAQMITEFINQPGHKSMSPREAMAEMNKNPQHAQQEFLKAHPPGGVEHKQDVGRQVAHANEQRQTWKPPAQNGSQNSMH